MTAGPQGTCDTRFATVRDAFLDNFSKRGDVGAAVCVYVDGRPVVDLWGGFADAARTRPWAQDTITSCGIGSWGAPGGRCLRRADYVMETGPRRGRPLPEGARVSYAPLYVEVQAAAAHGIRRRHRSTGAIGGEVTVAPRSVCTWK